jgi:flagellar biosynthesis protein FlhB
MSDKSDRDQQTELPTAKRKREAEKDGDVLQSRDLVTAMVVLSGAAWLLLAGPWLYKECVNLMRVGLSISPADIRNFDPGTQALRLAAYAALPLFTLMAVTILACFAGTMPLGGIGFRANAMAFKGSRLNPVTGLTRMFGVNGLIELAKSIAKAGLLGSVGWWVLADAFRVSVGLSRQDIVSGIAHMGGSLAQAMLVLSLCLLAIAGVDVPIQALRRNGRLRMTKQQVKEELRQTEGAPELKAHLRQRQFEVLKRSARVAVSEATVVLTNPTHYSVALRYRPEKDSVPIVVARGRNDTALAIRALAKEHSVPILEYPQLTRAIYFTSQPGHSVTEDLYIAVATVLAFVFNLERKLASHTPPPMVEVPEAKRFDENGKLNF